MSAQVYAIPRPARVKPEHRAEPNLFDPVFFHKSRVKVGTRFRYFGRMDPGTVWEVATIHSYTKSRSAKRRGEYNRRSVQQVHHLHDDVTLKCVTAGREGVPLRATTFSSLSYSAIWRLA